jgi:hypothetical protein
MQNKPGIEITYSLTSTNYFITDLACKTLQLAAASKPSLHLVSADFYV